MNNTGRGVSDEPTWERGDVVQAANGKVYERNSRYIDPEFVWRDFHGTWFRDASLPRPLVRMVPDA